MKKRCCTLIALVVTVVVFGRAPVSTAMDTESELAETAVEIYGSCTNGDDANDGSVEKPFRSLERAKEYVRTINSNMKKDINVYLHGGRYELNAPLEFSEEDSGTNNHTVRYLACDGEEVEISGGKQINGWSPYDEEKGIYRF